MKGWALESPLEGLHSCLAPGLCGLESGAQLGLLPEPLTCDLHGLGLPTLGPWGSKSGCVETPRSRRSRQGFALSDLIFAVVHCHFHCILLVIMNPLGLPRFKGRGIRIRLHLSGSFGKVTLQKGMWNRRSHSDHCGK